MKNFYRKLITTMLVLVIITAGHSILNAQTVQVTFKVDMSNVGTISPNGVHIAGNFQGWDPATTQMTPPPFGFYYTYTATLTPGETIYWKYINGTTWGEVENLVGAGLCVTGNDNNRFFVVPDQNITLDVVCFGKCNICNPPIVDITFRVDMSNEQVSPNGVHIAGSFQDPPWQPGDTEMLLIGNDVYAVTLQLGAGDYYEYKFINGTTWPENETVPPDCARGGNRYVEIPNVSSSLEAVCFGSCYACGPPPVDVEITFNVDMSQQTVSPDGVHLAAGFQGWDPGSTLMTDEGGGIFSYTAILSSGSYQEYKFVNGITWNEAEQLPEECSNNLNRYFTVPLVNTIMDTVCFGLCGPCPLPVEVNVTFQVDMSEQTVSGNGVHLIGSFNGYDPTATPMTLQRNGIYEATVVLTENEQHTYKFVNGNELSGEETVPVECAQENGYRVVDVPGEDLTIDAVCFGACEPCVPPPTANVTFNVDMTNEIVSPDGVHLAGSFQGWDPAGTPMTDMGNGLYSATLELVSGVHHTFKFINGTSFDFQETVPPACGEDDTFGGYNRFVDVPETDLTLDTVCFSSCSMCVVPVEVELTFLVDMQNEEVSPDGVFIAGSFNGWNTASDQMTLLADAVYSYTTTLIAGDNHEYKFLNGNSTLGYEEISGECTLGGNRYITVPETTTELPLVCFGLCEACPPPAQVEVTFQVDMSEETVSEDGVYIAGSFNFFSTTETPLTEMDNNIWAVTLTLTEGDYIMYKFINGNSFAGFETVPVECSQEDGNRELTVPGDIIVLEAVCFGSCEACIPPVTVDVVFYVDMSNETVSPDGVHVAGTFNDFSPDDTPLVLGDNNIYSTTITLDVGSHILYKFINGNTYAGVEGVPSACGEDDGFGGYNRFFDVSDPANVLDVVCFSSCAACVVPVYVDVTFQVDMANEEVSPDGVFIAGSFNGWNTASDQMTLGADAVYSYTTTLIAGDYHEYKFLNGNTNVGYEEITGECISNGNRYLTVPETLTELPLVCFGTCSACVTPVFVDVTFSVDMSNEIISPEGIYLAGSFNGYSSTETPMTLGGGGAGGMFTVTLSLVAGEHHTYKFLNGPSYDFAETVPAECGEDDGFGGFNRFVDVVEPVMGLDPVCFGSCDACSRDHSITLFEGWNSLSSYRLPDDTNIESLMSQISNELVVMQTMTEVYFPEGGLNTIVDWESQSAYKIKVSEDVTLNITGIVEQSKTLQLETGWNLMPVISDQAVNVETLFADVIAEVTVIKGIAEVGIFWPFYDINTLGSMQPGKAYFIKMTAPAQITFP